MSTEFAILGPLQVRQAGSVRALGSLRQRGLLARLIVRAGQPLSADRLLDELWPGETPEKARHTLHVYISRVRAVLGAERDRLQSDAIGYRLRFEPDELDATRFEHEAAAGRAALAQGATIEGREQLVQALRRWRGPALAEFVDEDFAVAEATRLEQLRLSTLEDRIHADLDLGSHAELVEELRSLTLEHPLREVFWEQLMLSLYRAGRQADALRVFTEARTCLADELGIEPGPSLQRMEQRVLAQDPALDPVDPPRQSSASSSGPHHNLPLQRTTFIGRTRDLAIARELLRGSRLLTLTGAPGSGKTRMALRLAADQAADYPDGVVFVPLAATPDPGLIGPAIDAALDALELVEDGGAAEASGPGAPGIVRRLCTRRCLLVLDNCEHLDGHFELVGELLDGAPNVDVLATSRAPLGLAGEQELPVLPLGLPPAGQALEPSALESYDAVALLVSRARALDPGFEVTCGNARAIAAIVARLDGLPLAIELGAGRLRLLTPDDLLVRLERRLPLLESGASDAIDRHRTLRAAIAWSYETLDHDEQHLFEHLAPFVGTFSVDAAAYVAVREPDEVMAGIESLLAKSLLQRPVEVGEARFALLQTLREFALEQLEAHGSADQAFERHARWFLLLTETVAPGLDDAAHESAMAKLNRDREDIRTALMRCAEGRCTEVGLRLASATWRYWQAAGRITEARAWLRSMLEMPCAEREVRASALTAAAGLAYWHADYEAAWNHYEEALELYRALGDDAQIAQTLFGMSTTATWNGDPAAGARLAEEARSAFLELGAEMEIGRTAMAQGFALWQQRQYEAARPRWEEALSISRAQGDDTLAVTQLAALAGLEYHMGARDDALRIALDCLDQAWELENVALSVWLLDFVAAFAAAIDPLGAVRVAGAADAHRTASGGGMTVESLHITPARQVAERSLAPVDVERAWTAGRTLRLEEAVSAARGLRRRQAVSVASPGPMRVD